jgi:septum formation protein
MKATAGHKSLRRSDRNRIILAADTIVVHNHRILNKARDRSHARQILASLSGKTHEVITGICLLRGNDVRLSRAIATCKFKKLSPARLTAYLDTNLWNGKAGAYGIQDDHDPFVTLVDGDITTVIGLPISLVQSELATFPKE